MGSMDKALETAVSILGSQTATAKALGVKQGQVWNWMNREGETPASQVIPLCRAVGYSVTPHQLRPDIYPYPLDGIPSRGGEVA